MIAAEKPDDTRQDELWEALYLTRPEVVEFLEHVRANGTLPWVFPMVAFAAYTGARRSEMLQALATDADLDGGTVTIREKKRVKGKRSHRIAPLTLKLAMVLREVVAALAAAAGSHRVGSRPDRVEPRRVKRRPKKYPRLHKARREVHAALLAEAESR